MNPGPSTETIMKIWFGVHVIYKQTLNIRDISQTATYHAINHMKDRNSTEIIVTERNFRDWIRLGKTLSKHERIAGQDRFHWGLNDEENDGFEY